MEFLVANLFRGVQNDRIEFNPADRSDLDLVLDTDWFLQYPNLELFPRFPFFFFFDRIAWHRIVFLLFLLVFLGDLHTLIPSSQIMWAFSFDFQVFLFLLLFETLHFWGVTALFVGTHRT